MTTGAGVGASLETTALLSSNPIGWAILGGIAAGTLITAVSDLAYQNNWFGTKDGVDWLVIKLTKELINILILKLRKLL